MSSDKDYKGYKCPDCGWIFEEPYCESCEKELMARDRGKIR